MARSLVVALLVWIWIIWILCIFLPREIQANETESTEAEKTSSEITDKITSSTDSHVDNEPEPAPATKPADANNRADTNMVAPENLTPNFSDWQAWASKYPNCDPRQNEFQSPIKINTKSATRDKNTSTLFVYSGTPLKNYYLLSMILHADNGYNMTAVNLQLEGERHHEATYISGLGDLSYRYFSYAIFLFSGASNTPPDLSLHQIDGKTFPMEIVMYFVNPRTDEDATQVHVMVEIGNVENPLFVPIQAAAVEMTSRVTNYKENGEKMMAKLQVAIQLEAVYMQATADYKAVAGNGPRLKALIARIAGLHASINANKKRLAMEKAKEEKEKHTLDVTKTHIADTELQLKKVLQQVDELAERQAELIEVENFGGALEGKAETDKLDGRRKQLLKDRETKQQNVDRLSASVTSQEMLTHNLEEMLQTEERRLKNLLSKNGFDSEEELKEEYADILQKNQDNAEAESEYLVAVNGLNDFASKFQLQVNIPVFQVSWLLPATGGHYRYNGSLPVPPCNRRAFTIVMENTITISQAQFDAVSSLVQFQITETAKVSLPIMSKAEDREIFYNKKNLQFILDDAVHMKSKKRKKLKQALAEEKNIGDKLCPCRLRLYFLLIGCPVLVYL